MGMTFVLTLISLEYDVWFLKLQLLTWATNLYKITDRPQKTEQNSSSIEATWLVLFKIIFFNAYLERMCTYYVMLSF